MIVSLFINQQLYLNIDQSDQYIDLVNNFIQILNNLKMIRYSHIARSMLQARYLLNHKKAPTEIPSSKPPKYIYEIKYHPVAKPGTDLKYPDHGHQNPFLDVAGSKHENFRYSYAGEWWEGYFIPKVLYFFAPVFTYLGILYVISKKKKRQVNAAYTVQVDSYPYHAAGSQKMP